MRLLRNLIIISVLLVSVTVQASDVDELVRIKQNYARMLVPSGKDPFGLLSILSSIQPETEISDQVVVELHQRYPFDLKKVETYLSSFTEAGTWPDINYDDKKRSGWEPKIHAERILELVKLYNSDQTSYYRSSEVEAVIHKALNYWFTAKPVCLNWWYNQIGIPKTLGTVFILFEKQLTPVEKQNAITVMENAKFGMTGQNKVWLAGNVMMRALLQNDYELVKMARDTIASEIVTGGAEGIKDDWCFHQHGAQQQFGNYGLSFVSGMSFFSGLFSGTSLAFDDKQLSILSTLIDKGYRWVTWKGMMDVNALGRQLFHHAPVHKALSLAFAASELGGGESDECVAVATALLRDNYPAPAVNVLTGHKHFWQSDYTIHRRPSWMASIKMASDRIIGTEMMNGDNMKGYYMADGATYIYKDGKEYLDIFPLWDWRKLPGVTAFEDNAPMPLIKSYQPRNKGTFVGAVSDEKQGMTVMELDRAGVKAHKAWVCTDDFILCLGAGIQADSNLVVTTSIEQCHKNGELLSWENARWNVVNTRQSVKGKEQKIQLPNNLLDCVKPFPAPAVGKGRARPQDFLGLFPGAVSGDPCDLRPRLDQFFPACVDLCQTALVNGPHQIGCGFGEDHLQPVIHGVIQFLGGEQPQNSGVIEEVRQVQAAVLCQVDFRQALCRAGYGFIEAAVKPLNPLIFCRQNKVHPHLPEDKVFVLIFIGRKAQAIKIPNVAQIPAPG